VNYGTIVLNNGTTNTIIDGNDVRGHVGGGIADYSYTATLNANSIFRNNTVHNPGGSNQEAGIVAINTTNFLAYNNIVHHDFRCFKAENVSGPRFYNNTCAYNTWGVYIGSGAQTTALKNNIIDSPPGYPGIQDFGTSTVLFNNVCPTSTIGCNTAGSLNFTNVSAGDYSLTVGSVAIEAGIPLTEVPVDILNVSRPQQANYDAGAYEYVPGAMPQVGTIMRMRPYAATGAFTIR